MTPLLFAFAAAAGAVGRYGVGRVWCSLHAVLIVNTIGSGLLGWIAASDLSSSATTALGLGFCGAFTTFGSFADQVRQLGWRSGAGYAAITMICVCGAASLGATF